MSDFSSVDSLPASAEAEIEKKIDAVRKRVLEGKPDPNFNSPADPKDVEEYQNDAIQGQHLTRPEVWRQVMEAHGFTWFSPAELDSKIGKERYVPSKIEGIDLPGGGVSNDGLYFERPNRVGQWRRNRGRLAFTIQTLFAHFGSPEVFDRWIREYESKLFRARLGLR